MDLARRHPPSARSLVALFAAALVVAAAVATLLWSTGGRDAGNLLPPPAAPAPIGTVTRSSPPPAGPSTAAPGGDPAPRPSSSTPPRRAPKLVGPRDAGGFERLLSAYCVRRGQRTAILLPDEGDRAAGEWVCLRAVTFTRIRLDDPCREKFGDTAQARQIRPGDARTWRCFDA